MAEITTKENETGEIVIETASKPNVLSEEQKQKKREEDARLAQSLKNVTHYITTPAGLPPYDLEGEDYESVRDWVSKIKTTGNHTVQSCQFWVKYFYDPFQEKEKWRAVRNLIEERHSDLSLPHFPYKKIEYKKPEQITWGRE